jgi:hypothetical protein
MEKSMSSPRSVSVTSSAGDGLVASEPAQWAIGHLKDTLRRRGFMSEAGGGNYAVVVTSPETAPAHVLADLPDAPESFALTRSGDSVNVVGRDARGLVYGLTELADRASRNGEDPFAGIFPLICKPSAKTRSILRIFANEKEDKPWFYDRSHWVEYLTMLATNRFNRFSLTLGIQYDYPYHNFMISDVYLHFPYPYLVDLPQYGIGVLELSKAEQQANLEMLKFIGRQAAKRGLEFQLGLWSQRYDFDDVPDANYTVTGVTDENHSRYCRDAIAAILREVPQITGLTFRIHVEGGIAEGDYGFWRTVFEGIKAAGRPIEIDMHAKGLDETTLNVALETGLPVCASPKYLAEHMGLAYHPSAIREREYPPAEEITNRERLSVGSRRFLRQSYGDLLPKDKKWRVVFRVWPGTQRVLAWGDPELAAGYGRSASFCGADGIEWMEPLSMKGRQGSGAPGGRALYKDVRLSTRLDWKKYAYQYRLWGRLSYDPDADTSETLEYLAATCGDAAPFVHQALAASSKILPLVTLTHAPSIANNIYWPEIYTNIALVGDNPVRPYAFDTDAPLRFGNVGTFDPQMFANAREFIAGLLTDTPDYRYSPLDVASWLSTLAETAETAAVRANATVDIHRPDAQRLIIDAQVAAAIGRFFAEKQRAACWAELYIATCSRSARLKAAAHLRSARSAWKDAVMYTRETYDDDITFGPGAHMRGSWANRLNDLDRELRDLEAHQEPKETTTSENAVRVANALSQYRLMREASFALEVPATFVRGSAVMVRFRSGSAPAQLHYRHVNQAERWRSVDMTISDGWAEGEIPADYTDNPFHLQLFATVILDGSRTIVPGFDRSLAGQPYLAVLQV